MGEKNERNPENKGGNMRNGMGMPVRGISVGISGIWVEMQKNMGNQDGDAENQGGNLCVMAEMT